MIPTLQQAHDFADMLVKQAREKASAIPDALMPRLNAGVPFTGDQKAKRQYDRNTGVPYSSIRPIATRIAGQPIRVARVLRGQEAQERGLKDWQVKQVPQRLRGMIRPSRRKDTAQNLEILENHPLLDAIDDPNALMVSYSMLFVTAFSLQLTARGYWWMTKSKRAKGTIDIWPLPTHWVTPDDTAGFRDRWLIRIPGSAQAVPVPGENIAPFFYPNPQNPFEAWGPTQAAASDITTNESIKEAQRMGFQNGIFPALGVRVGDVDTPDGPKKPRLEQWQVDDLETRLRQLFGGANRYGKFILFDALIQGVEQLTRTNQEMDYQASGEATKQAIMQIYGTNPIIAGQVENANRASALEAKSNFCDFVVNPTIILMSQVINEWVLPLFRRGQEQVVAWIEECEPLNTEHELSVYQYLSGMGGVTIDEARTNLAGLPPLPNGWGNRVVTNMTQVFESVDDTPDEELEPESEPDDEPTGSEDEPQDGEGDGVKKKST